MTHRRILTGVATILLALLFPIQIFAHGGEPRLEISADSLSPGGTVDVRGVDFESEEIVTLSLTGPSGEIAMGEVTADVDGVFLQTVVLPVELIEGSYMFRAVTDDHEILSPALLVSGPPIVEGEAEGQRDEDDALLGPMPTYSPVILQSTAIPASVSSTESGSSPRSIPLISLAAVALLAVTATWILLRRR